MARLANPRWRTWLVAGALATLPTLAGCGHFWEDVTARSPEPGVWPNVQHRWNLVFNRPEPLQVIASSSDGDMRRRALQDLDVNGSFWKKEDPEMMFRVLSTSALQERDTICRVMAVEKLGELKDPRVNEVLAEVFNAPSNQDAQHPAVKLAVLQAVGKRGDPAGLPLLTAALKSDNHSDLRQAAADAMGRMQKNDQAAAELVRVLREDKDVAMKYRAYQALRRMTGRDDLPPKADAWEKEFQAAAASGKSPYQEPNPLIKLATFWSED